MRKVVCILLLILAAVSVVRAQDKVTIDPNAPGAAKQAVVVLKPDSRLEQKITLNAGRRSVLSILADLQKMTGVTFRAGYNSQDWQVRDRRMNVFARDVPVRDLTQSIARVMKFKWSRGGQAPNWTYRLYMDRKTLLDAETKRLREEESARQEKVKLTTDLLAQYGKLGSLSPAEMAKLKEKDPFTYALTKIGVTQGLGAFFDEVPAAAEALAGGQEMTISGANLSAACIQGLISSVEASNRFEAMISGKEQPPPNDVTGDPSSLIVTIDPSFFGEMTSQSRNNILLGMIFIKTGGQNPNREKHGFPVMLMNPDSKIARFLGQILIRCEEEKKPIEDIMKSSQTELTQAGMADVKKMSFGEPSVDHSKEPDDPDLQKKITLKCEKPWLEDAESALCDAGGLAIVSDAFDRQRWMAQVAGGEMQLKEAIDKIAAAYIYNWEKHPSIVEFRDRDWYRKRLEQIPQAWIDGWADTLKKTGTLDLPDLVQIAALTQVQFMRNLASEDIFADSDLNSVCFSSTDQRELLRAYGSLTDSQRAAVLARDGLDFGGLSQDQLSQFVKLIARKNASFLQSRDARYMLSATREGMDKRTMYVFKLATTDDLKPLEWKIPLPAYLVLKKDQQKPAKAPAPTDPPKQQETGPGK